MFGGKSIDENLTIYVKEIKQYDTNWKKTSDWLIRKIKRWNCQTTK
jgi:hypothetical protein